ncbi:hypothetical protein PVAG01_03005 [Phlyctema vagabunda]|uniref:Uncharacterized protein n=1 Tax=Phlyctema vagabunda TaxID=108571 RepID=A0ABR4PSA5_9HELO
MLGLSHFAAFQPPTLDGTPRKPPPPTVLKFPQCAPQSEDGPSPSRDSPPIVPLLQSIHRPTDIKLSHFEALGLHVLRNAPAEDILPDPSFLPPVEQWMSVSPSDLEEANPRTRKPLNNGNLSPGLQTYLERQHELSLDNTAAFRTVRRIPPPAGEQAVRLGNAYEFYKNLEFFSGYWIDTSLPPEAEAEREKEAQDADTPPVPTHLQTHLRTGNGSQLPPDYRQHLLSAFIKLVAYDFGCNVSLPRCEPRLQLFNSPSAASPASYYPSGCTFIYRSPTDRNSARAGIVEGPVAALSCRTATTFADPLDERLDLAREVVAVLLTAQQRAREGKTEVRFGEGKWWTEKKRWGGGAGGPIGREAEKVEAVGAIDKIGTGEKVESEVVAAAKAAIGPSPAKRTKKERASGNMSIYDNYRKLAPPSSTWDRKARYEAIGKVPGTAFDDVFLVSALNHHISVIRVRVPGALIETFEGHPEANWGRLCMWRSKWYDLFLAKERIEAMQLVWGMMGYLMRKIEVAAPETGAERESTKMEVD